MADYMKMFEMKAQRQQEEIATIAPRPLTLNLSDADVERIALYAARGGMTVAELLEGFIGDLVDGTYSHGSDERDYADRWYERCGFEHMADDNIAKLAREDYLETMIEYCNDYKTACEEVEYFKQNLQSDEDITEDDIKIAEKWQKESLEDVERLMQQTGCEGTQEDLMKEVMQWKKAFDYFAGQSCNV